jgi:hypothetical protein
MFNFIPLHTHTHTHTHTQLSRSLPSTSHFQLFGLLKHETDSPAISFRNSRTVNMVFGEVCNRRGEQNEGSKHKTYTVQSLAHKSVAT